MTPQPNEDHTLNACLARVIGRKISEVKIGTHPNHVYTWMVLEANQWIKWNPLHDANQMEEVEAWLRENDFEYITGWSKQGSNHWAELRNTGKAFWSCDTDKKRAFALAVYAMEQSQKGTT